LIPTGSWQPQDVPALSLTGSYQPQDVPDLYESPEPPPHPEVPDLISPAITELSQIDGVKFYELSALGAPWENMYQKQVDYFKSTLPQQLSNIAERALPNFGKIDTELLPSTIFTKALNVANKKIQDLENKYAYDHIANAGKKVSQYIGTAMGVNYASEGQYTESSKAGSLKKINEAFRKDISLSNIFERESRQLQQKYTDFIKSDPKYDAFQANTRYRVKGDTDDGLLDPNLDVRTQAKSTYFPFYMVDLRPDRSGKYRTVFFQPFNLELKENFAPSWSPQNYIGRVDPVSTYQNTTRTLSISFKMVAMHPDDLKIIYGKLKWLTAMVYPEYSPNMRYKSGPIVKLRIGDIINASSLSVPLSSERPGVSGYLTSLDFNYDKIWEIDDNWQVPRNIDVSFGFTVLHELPVGVLDGAFGTVGFIDEETNIFTTPQQASDKIGGAGKFSDDTSGGPAPAEFVDDRGFRSVGPDSSQSAPIDTTEFEVLNGTE
jgi:hypothetical protein